VAVGSISTAATLEKEPVSKLRIIPGIILTNKILGVLPGGFCASRLQEVKKEKPAQPLPPEMAVVYSATDGTSLAA
jgi:hypothetical protein